MRKLRLKRGYIKFTDFFFLTLFFFLQVRQVMCQHRNKVWERHTSRESVNTQSSCLWTIKGSEGSQIFKIIFSPLDYKVYGNRGGQVLLEFFPIPSSINIYQPATQNLAHINPSLSNFIINESMWAMQLLQQIAVGNKVLENLL